jgi:hypothetical protein
LALVIQGVIDPVQSIIRASSRSSSTPWLADFPFLDVTFAALFIGFEAFFVEFLLSLG